jgi:DNA-binding transcriptional regulator YhcF (GntR family)
MAQSSETHAQDASAGTPLEAPEGRGEPTPFSADPADELPVGVQLSWRLRALIASGHLTPGERLPSVRALAGWAGVNVNTVRSVYRRLEEEGLVATQHGSGSFVAPGVPSSPEAERIATEAIADAREAGISPRQLALVAWVCASVPEGLAEELPAELPEELSEVSDEADLDLAQLPELELPDVELPSDEPGARRELRRQIARLEAQLASYPEAGKESEATHPLLRPKAHVAGVAELEAVRDELMARLKRARTAAERHGARQNRARARRESMIRDPEAHRWEYVGNEEVGDPSCGETRVVPRYGPLGVLMNWWRVKVSGGCPLAAPREAAWIG